MPTANLDENSKIIRSNSDGFKETAKVTVSYEGFSASYDVTISNTVSKIEISLDNATVKTSYNVGDTLDTSGVTVKAFYSDDDTSGDDITNAASISANFSSDSGLTDFTTANPGEFSLIFTASYNGKTANSDPLPISVSQPTQGGEIAPNLSSYYKKYFVTTENDVAKFTRSLDTWGCGGTTTENADGTLTLTPGAVWGGSTVVAAFNDIGAGALSLYEYLVITLDISDATIVDGSGNDGVNIKIPEVQKPITDNWVSNADGTRTYYAKISDFTDDSGVNAAKAANQFALIAGATGTVIVKEVYAAAAEDPASIAITGITITPDTVSLQQSSTQQFTVKDSSLNDVTSSVTYTLTGDAAEGSSISDAGLLTVGTTSGTLTVTATYNVDGEDFTDTATVNVLASFNNLVTNVSLNKVYLAPNFVPILNNETDIAKASEYLSIDGTTVSYTLVNGLSDQWQAQLKINTDASIANGDDWYFSCKLSGVTGGYTIKLNDSEELIKEQTGRISDATEGITVSFSGTAPIDISNIPIMFDFGTCTAGTVVISDILIAKTN